MRATRTLGLEEGRKQLPQLAALAHAGEGSLLTKHGKPYAAIVSPDLLVKSRRKSALLSLRGTGKGLWGKSAAKYVAELRDDWS
ncbi:Prevent-host-death protein [Caenimonas koreensis DSM 17982]|uniref:Prevent-host-death protein n=1 Tax=Caenimonas koreensis DSM 17982 TaxID=1121255 RepID=A0A844B7N2_9BURK|nr:Prevent-host-death protein [Caenimonas koreensis]MRD47426.1 Prevent-host-death protein [Caenimonas koreensis DSM 17982]